MISRMRQSLECIVTAHQRQLVWLAALLSVGVVASAVAIAMAWSQPPLPMIHDDFSLLLQADTLRQGRMANPAPEVWQPFQTFHVIVNPSYASKYPLGPGALLALGWILFGSPAAGLWLGAGMCAMAIAWAAAGCMPRTWAAFAGFLVALNPCVHYEWSLNYTNGWLAATASALAAGSLFRLRKATRTRHALLLGAGLGGLAITRPFEGLIFTACCAGLLLYWWRGLPLSDQSRRIARIAGVAAIPLACTVALIASHNQATTGHWWQMAYQLHESQYGVAPLTVLQTPKTPQMCQWLDDVSPTILKFHYGWSLEGYLRRSGFFGWFTAIVDNCAGIVQLWGIVFCFVAISVLTRGCRAFRPLAWSIGVALIASSLIPWFLPHYFAPAFVWLVLLTALGCREILWQHIAERQRRVAWLAVLMLAQIVSTTSLVLLAQNRPLTWAHQRQQLTEQLVRDGRKHLVLVRYHVNHSIHQEWVQNWADLEQTSVIWARSWRPDLDDRLMRQYADQRQIWVLEFDEADRPTLRRAASQHYSLVAR